MKPPAAATRLAIVQSNYIPWKGYFDLMGSVDEFVLYDDAQFTKNDWRNRNVIKTPNGPLWLSIPVGPDINRRIRDVVVNDDRWRTQHWKSLRGSYARAAYFAPISAMLEPLYCESSERNLSAINQSFIEAIGTYLGIRTRIRRSWDYRLEGDRNERLVSLCKQAGASVYVSGPAARSYLDESLFEQAGIAVQWFDYVGYPEYPQLWGAFSHSVSIVDLLFNCGPDSPAYMKLGGEIATLDNGKAERS